MCSRCNWEEVLDEIHTMLNDPDFRFAEDTLTGIGEWVEANSHITDRQEEAVANIRDAVESR